jgi:hypothetical protein
MPEKFKRHVLLVSHRFPVARGGQSDGPGFFFVQAGTGPVHGGSASHSVHRIRRSSSPTRIKTKGASSLPVFDPANMAGVPYASRMTVLFAMARSRQNRVPDCVAMIEFKGIWHLTAFLIEAGAQCSQSPITAGGGR